MTHYPRILKCLKIAWTAVCGICCVLLAVLWVLSYSRLETISGGGRGADSVSVFKGCLFVNEGGFTFINDDSTVSDQMTFVESKPLAGGRIRLTSHLGVSDLKYVTRGNGWKFPIWLVAAAVVVVGVVPWLPVKRFSLRTLLIATTVVALVLGLIVYAMRG